MPHSLDRSAPIEPGIGMGGIRLRTHISEWFELIKWLTVRGGGFPPSRNGEAYLQSPYHIAYELNIGVTMVFNTMNGRIYKLTADSRYQGTLFGKLRPGMPFAEARSIEPRLTFNKDEEVWEIAGVSGVSIDTDGRDDHIEAINVFVVELAEALKDFDKMGAFERGLWS